MDPREKIGAIASKKDRLSMPRRAWIDSESASEVRGPVATIAGAGGRSVISWRTILMPGSASRCAVTASANRWRSTASALPAGTLNSSATWRRRHPRIRISALRRPCGVSWISDLKELVQTISARRSVLCAGVGRTGRISYRSTWCPRRANCQAASDPASPPPTTVTRRSAIRIRAARGFTSGAGRPWGLDPARRAPPAAREPGPA